MSVACGRLRVVNVTHRYADGRVGPHDHPADQKENPVAWIEKCEVCGATFRFTRRAKLAEVGFASVGLLANDEIGGVEEDAGGGNTVGTCRGTESGRPSKLEESLLRTAVRKLTNNEAVREAVEKLSSPCAADW